MSSQRLRFVRRTLLLVALVIFQLEFIPSTPALAAGDPIVNADWNVPARTQAGADGFIDFYRKCTPPSGWTLESSDKCSSVQDIHPTSWPVTFDACQSMPGDTTAVLTDYRFSIRQTGAVTSGAVCSRTMNVPEEGGYTVDITVTDSGGRSTTQPMNFQVRDILFASLGDSYGSGEGNPPFVDSRPCVDSITVCAVTGTRSTRCNRSTRAAAAQAALQIENSDSKSSVTFLHLACSGAKILDPNPSDSVAEGGMLQPYEGVQPIVRPSGVIDVLPPQVEFLDALVGNRKIDFLHLSIGGNDMGFASIIKACIDLSFWFRFDLWLAMPNCYVDIIGSGGIGSGFVPAVSIFNKGIATLPEAYRRLNAALESTLSRSSVELDANGTPFPVLSPERVYLMEYPDFTRDHAGDFCGWPKYWALPGRLTDLPGFTQTEFEWASKTVAPSLLSVMEQSADGFGWRYVGGISAPYATHGYCSNQNWVNTIEESEDQQNGQGDRNGAFHPNIDGQNIARDRLFARLSADLKNPPLPPTVKLYKTGLFITRTTAGSSGWDTGSCDIALFGPGGTCDRNAAYYTIEVKGTPAIKGPLESNLSFFIDGQAATIARSGSSFTCAPADPADACDVYADTSVTNPPNAFIVLKMTRGGSHQLSVRATNVRNVTAQVQYDLKVDLVPPTVGPVQVTSGTLGANSWYTTPVGLQFSASDAMPGSGVAAIDTLLLGEGPGGEHLALATTGNASSGPITAMIAGEGRHVVGYESIDNAGLRSGDPLTITPSGRKTFDLKIDTRPPNLVASPDRAPDIRGWYNASVTVTCNATDPVPGSGVDSSSVTPPMALIEGANQVAACFASDFAGHTVSANAGPISVDTTLPSAAITGVSDGSFSYAQSDLADGAIVTNSSSLSLSYSASDALSGLHEIRIAGQQSAASAGTFTVPLNSGFSTYTLEIEDVAGNVHRIEFDVLRTTAPLSSDPRGPGYWRTAIRNGAYTESAFGELLQFANAVSRSFGKPGFRYDDATLHNFEAILQPYPASAVDDRVRRQLLAAWLNVVSGREGTLRQVDLSKISGWQTVVKNTSGNPRTTALNVLQEVERRLGESPSRGVLETIAAVLEAFNSGKLNT